MIRVAVVANAMAELDAAGVALYSDQQTLDSTGPFGVFGELERELIRARVVAGLNRHREQSGRLGRPTIARKTEDAMRQQLGAGHGILKVAKIVGVGSGTVQRIKREMAAGVGLTLANGHPDTILTLRDADEASEERHRFGIIAWDEPRADRWRTRLIQLVEFRPYATWRIERIC
jgi:hypothetical protein